MTINPVIRMKRATFCSSLVNIVDDSQDVGQTDRGREKEKGGERQGVKHRSCDRATHRQQDTERPGHKDKGKV